MVLFNPAPSLLVFKIPHAFMNVKTQQKPWIVPGNMQTWKCCRQQQMPQTCCAPMWTQLLYPQASWLGWSGFQSTPSETFFFFFKLGKTVANINTLEGFSAAWLIPAVIRAERENNKKIYIKNCQTKHAIYQKTLTLVESQTFNWINPTLKDRLRQDSSC